MHAQVSNDGSIPDTWFAPPERMPEEPFRELMTTVTNSPVIDGVLTGVGGLVAVLNEQRQLMAMNDAFLRSLDLDDAAGAMGLRPGEALGCLFAKDHESGCGTGRYCSTCGAVLAVLASQESGEAEERRCALSAVKNGKEFAVEFAVRASPIEIEGHRLTLLLLRDVSAEKRRESLHRTFFHDIGNMLTGLCAASHLLASDPESLGSSTVESIHDLATLMAREVEIHRSLVSAEPGRFRVVRQDTTASDVLQRLRAIYASHPVSDGQTLDSRSPDPDLAMRTDVPILLRVLANLVTNAFEAGEPGDQVRATAERFGEGVVFSVWNRTTISPEVARRVFQRYYSTKGGPGRGLGTHAVRWLTEEFLEGVVSFESSPEEGTTFRVRLPA